MGPCDIDGVQFRATQKKYKIMGNPGTTEINPILVILQNSNYRFKFRLAKNSHSELYPIDIT